DHAERLGKAAFLALLLGRHAHASCPVDTAPRPCSPGPGAAQRRRRISPKARRRAVLTTGTEACVTAEKPQGRRSMAGRPWCRWARPPDWEGRGRPLKAAIGRRAAWRCRARSAGTYPG